MGWIRDSQSWGAERSELVEIIEVCSAAADEFFPEGFQKLSDHGNGSFQKGRGIDGLTLCGYRRTKVL